MSLLRAMTTVAGMTGLSRIAGFARDILTASILGAGPVADAFFVALKLPNFFRRVTAEGAFSVSFVPLYSSTLEQEGPERARIFASNAFWIMTLILSVFCGLAMIFMPYVLMVIAPGFSDDPLRYDLGVELSRITFPYLLLMSLTALLGGVLNAHDRFAPFAFAPVLFNLCLIAALLLSGYFETPGHALSYGILTAGFAQLFMLLFCAWRLGIRIKVKVPEFSPKIRKVFALMGPGVIGAGVMHINLFADLILASFLDEGAISYLYYADRLNQLPLGVVGIAVGTALLPMLSKALSREDSKEAHHLFNRALEYCLIFALPAALALLVIPYQLIEALFQRGVFSAEDTNVTASVLMAYAVGLPPYILIKIFSTVHWARQDTTTPVKISVTATVFNIGLSIILIYQMGVAGIALATGLAGWLQLVMHVYTLRKTKVVGFDDAFKKNLLKIVGSTAVMVAVLLALSFGLPMGLNKYVVLTALVSSGIVSYGACVFISGALNVQKLKAMVRRRA